MPTSTFQVFVSCCGQVFGSVNDETTPSRFGPRHCGQSAERRCAETRSSPHPATTTNATTKPRRHEEAVIWSVVNAVCLRSITVLRALRALRSSSYSRLLFDGDDILQPADDDRAGGNCRRGYDDLAEVVRGQQLVRRSGLDHEHVAILAREVQLTVCRYRRRAERSASTDTLLIYPLAGAHVVRRQHRVDLQHVEVIAVNHRRRDVRAAAIGAPRNRRVLRLTACRCDVAARTWFDRKNRLHAPIAVGDDNYAGAHDRRRNGDLRVTGEPPQFFAVRRIVPANERRRLRDEFRPAVVLEDRRRRPGRDLFARGAPHGVTGCGVERGDERVLLDVALDDDEI